jgi:hypothetical protein
MMRSRLVFEVASVLILLSACSAPPAETQDKAQPDDQPAQPTVFSDTVGTMDRARAVQDSATRHGRELEDAEEAQGR